MYSPTPKSINRSTGMETRKEFIERFRNEEYRRAFVDSHVGTGLAFQLRMLREDRGWSQGDVAAKTDRKQPAISQLENPEYGRYSLSTLKSMAAVYDVALLVRFVPFGDLYEWTAGLSPERLTPLSYDGEIAGMQTGQFADSAGGTPVIANELAEASPSNSMEPWLIGAVTQDSPKPERPPLVATTWVGTTSVQKQEESLGAVA